MYDSIDLDKILLYILLNYFRDGANPAFHAAIGDAISLSVRTPRHLYYMGLLDEVNSDEGKDLQCVN